MDGGELQVRHPVIAVQDGKDGDSSSSSSNDSGSGSSSSSSSKNKTDLTINPQKNLGQGERQGGAETLISPHRSDDDVALSDIKDAAGDSPSRAIGASSGKGKGKAPATGEAPAKLTSREAAAAAVAAKKRKHDAEGGGEKPAKRAKDVSGDSRPVEPLSSGEKKGAATGGAVASAVVPGTPLVTPEEIATFRDYWQAMVNLSSASLGDFVPDAYNTAIVKMYELTMESKKNTRFKAHAQNVAKELGKLGKLEPNSDEAVRMWDYLFLLRNNINSVVLSINVMMEKIRALMFPLLRRKPSARY
jgi:hypothetical protein